MSGAGMADEARTAAGPGKPGPSRAAVGSPPGSDVAASDATPGTSGATPLGASAAVRPEHSRVLGRLLVERGDADGAQVLAALREQQRTRERLGGILVRLGVPAEGVARALAAQLRLPYADSPLTPDPAALRLVGRDLAARLRVVPLRVDERTLRVAMADPLDAGAIDDLQFRTGRRVEPVVASPAGVESALTVVCDAGEVEALVGRLQAAVDRERSAQPADELGALRRASEAAPIVALVDLLLQRALAVRASDLHVEPGARELCVRARVDGVLRELVRLPAHVGAAMTSRIKIMAGLDIAVKRRPQDGRFSPRVRGRPLAVRVSTLPAVNGEKVVLRLLAEGVQARTLDELGLGAADRRRLDGLLGRSHGLVLATGPTGSGKTTTLYAILSGLDRRRYNVTSIEDPVETKLDGVTQVQVQARGGVSFASALRAVLRQDPDVIMVGEMRDRETVEVALAAALTGHLVLATLHTNDAATAVTRLLEMGAQPHLIAGGLAGVVAQRLVRRRCRACDGTGRCERCEGTGFHGRVGVFEVLVVDEELRSLVLRRAGAGRVRRAAVQRGMRTLAQDAAAKMQEGETTRQEVEPLLRGEAGRRTACPGCGAIVRRAFVRCPACGRMLGRRCGCGARLEADWAWCPACGRAQSSNSTSLCSVPS